MVRALALAALLLLTPGTVAAHDETPYIDYLKGILAAMEQAPDSAAEGVDAWDATRQGLLSTLLSTVPMECYQALYVADWLIYADLVALDEARRRDQPEVLDRLAVSLSVSRGMLPEASAACMASPSPGP